MMVSIVQSFALGNAIIAEVLPCSTSTLINNKLPGFVWGGDGSGLKIKGMGGKNRRLQTRKKEAG